jgi:S-formylglutathione hydrolase FrmB
VRALEEKWALAKDDLVPRVIAGHSSGGYGALALGMSRHSEFAGVVALSPDSDFATTHKPFADDPAVRAFTPAELELAMAPAGSFRLPENGLVSMMIGLSANYVPSDGKPGRFDWLYDAQGQWRPEVRQRWLDLDPLVIARRRVDAFAPEQRVYLDGAEHDEFGANIGARKIYEVLRERKSPVTFSEPPGGHGDNLPGRLEAGLEWIFGRTNGGDHGP